MILSHHPFLSAAQDFGTALEQRFASVRGDSKHSAMGETEIDFTATLEVPPTGVPCLEVVMRFDTVMVDTVRRQRELAADDDLAAVQAQVRAELDSDKAEMFVLRSWEIGVDSEAEAVSLAEELKPIVDGLRLRGLNDGDDADAWVEIAHRRSPRAARFGGRQDVWTVRVGSEEILDITAVHSTDWSAAATIDRQLAGDLAAAALGWQTPSDPLDTHLVS